MSQVTQDKILAHMASHENDLGYLKEAITEIKASVKKAEENHWTHVQESTGEINQKLELFQKDFHELVRLFTEHKTEVMTRNKIMDTLFWIIIGASVSSLAVEIISLVYKPHL